MGLNIKNEEVTKLVAELAELTGQSQTAAVKFAVKEQLRSLKSQMDVEVKRDKLRKIVDRFADVADRLPPSTEIGDLLYDEDGLPK